MYIQSEIWFRGKKLQKEQLLNAFTESWEGDAARDTITQLEEVSAQLFGALWCRNHPDNTECTIVVSFDSLDSILEDTSYRMQECCAEFTGAIQDILNTDN